MGAGLQSLRLASLEMRGIRGRCPDGSRPGQCSESAPTQLYRAAAYSLRATPRGVFRVCPQSVIQGHWHHGCDSPAPIGQLGDWLALSDLNLIRRRRPPSSWPPEDSCLVGSWLRACSLFGRPAWRCQSERPLTGVSESSLSRRPSLSYTA